MYVFCQDFQVDEIGLTNLVLNSYFFQTFRKFMSGVLKKAHEINAQSIALPAIGTGNLKIPPAHVAQWMYSEVEEFSRNNPTTSLRNVKFVINDTDTAILSVCVSLSVVSALSWVRRAVT